MRLPRIGILSLTAVLLAALYTGDFLWLSMRSHHGHSAFETVQVENYSAVPEKNNRVEFFYGDPDSEECVHALFPHSGDSPCWYVLRHRTNRNDL